MGWLAGWGRRKSHIVNSATGAGTNYQVGIKVYKGSGTDGTETVNGITFGKVYCGGNCQDDFGDIRFTASDGISLLDYWMEELSSGVYAIFWVEVSGDLGAGNVTIYVYYDTSGTSTTTSDGDTTFIFWDDFDNLNDWSQYTKSGHETISVADSKVRLQCPTGANACSVYTAALAQSSCALRIWGVDIDLIGNNQLQLNASTGDSTTDLARFVIYDLTSGGGGNSDVVGGTRRGSPPVTEEVFRDLNVGDTYDKATMDILIAADRKPKFLIEGTDKGTATNAIDDETWRIQLYAAGSRGDSDIYIDGVFLRKYVSPEPAHSTWGSEETPTKPAPSSIVHLMDVLDMI